LQDGWFSSRRASARAALRWKKEKKTASPYSDG
jgi:hypothetical protein